MSPLEWVGLFVLGVVGGLAYAGLVVWSFRFGWRLMERLFGGDR